MEYPFTQHNLKPGTFLRTFDSNIPESELQWHYDEKDRTVQILESDQWMLQLDNALPILLEKGKSYFIPQGVYHRIHRGVGSLKILIQE